jgi:hypothetical protein
MSAHRRFVPRFMLRDLLAATAVIAGGIAAVQAFFSDAPWETYWWIVCGLAGGALVGAGIGLPAGRVGRALVVVLVLQSAVFVIAFLLTQP